MNHLRAQKAPRGREPVPVLAPGRELGQGRELAAEELAGELAQARGQAQEPVQEPVEAQAEAQAPEEQE